MRGFDGMALVTTSTPFWAAVADEEEHIAPETTAANEGEGAIGNGGRIWQEDVEPLVGSSASTSGGGGGGNGLCVAVLLPAGGGMPPNGE
mmetsp:Transcript_22252/g.25775  ORF Transcript_22252/g.25775 Transcript_22252/m.25775 type:complete len:90 (-) Transcript_22252:525-794(-)